MKNVEQSQSIQVNQYLDFMNIYIYIYNQIINQQDRTVTLDRRGGGVGVASITIKLEGHIANIV